MISVNITKAMAMKGKMNARTKIVINNNIIEQVNSFSYLGYKITVPNNRDFEINWNRFNQMCSTIRRTLKNKTRKETQAKFYKAMALSVLTYRSEIWIATKEQAKKIKTAEMKLLRSLHKEGPNKKC
jgi:hypothetical protein